VDAPILGRPLWYELMTTEPAAAQAFYTAVVGWTASPFDTAPFPYSTLSRDDDWPVAGVLGRPPGVDLPPFWTMHVGVPHLEDATARVAQLGGGVASPVIAVANIGRMQLMSDPQGAAFYLYEPATTDFPAEAPAEVGDAAWIELVTTDAPAAMRFYGDLFGWTPGQPVDMGVDGTYHLFRRPQATIGGMMNRIPPMGQVPPHWRIYFRVADLEASVARIRANGGHVLHGPMDVDGGARIVNAIDPQGATFSILGQRA
jgi:predicted enzyme related to lactoylglutathione lyase